MCVIFFSREGYNNQIRNNNNNNSGCKRGGAKTISYIVLVCAQGQEKRKPTNNKPCGNTKLYVVNILSQRCHGKQSEAPQCIATFADGRTAAGRTNGRAAKQADAGKADRTDGRMPQRMVARSVGRTAQKHTSRTSLRLFVMSVYKKPGNI